MNFSDFAPLVKKNLCSGYWFKLIFALSFPHSNAGIRNISAKSGRFSCRTDLDGSQCCSKQPKGTGRSLSLEITFDIFIHNSWAYIIIRQMHHCQSIQKPVTIVECSFMYLVSHHDSELCLMFTGLIPSVWDKYQGCQLHPHNQNSEYQSFWRSAKKLEICWIRKS